MQKESRIALIALGNLYRLPYINKYIELAKNVHIDVIYWDREAVQEKLPNANLIPFYYRLNDSVLKKFRGYLKFRNFVMKKLAITEYDLVIVTPTPTAILLGAYLEKHYNHKYIVDIRDYCFEHNAIVKYLEKKVVKSSALSVISSKGYKDFLPSEFDYLVVHNDRPLDDKKVDAIRNRNKHRKPINIGFIGYIGYHDQHKRMIELFKNDDRFKLSFKGQGGDDLVEYCKAHRIDNVNFVGKFDPSETLDMYEDIDIVNGIYGKNCPALDHALSNKLYFSAELDIPIISNKNTYMEKVSKEFNIGIGFDVNNPDSPNMLAEYYDNNNWEKMRINCQSFINVVKEENEQFEKTVGELLQNI